MTDLILAAIVMFSCFTLGVLMTSDEHENVIGKSYSQIVEMKESCEEDLPRDKFCKIIVEVKPVGE